MKLLLGFLALIVAIIAYQNRQTNIGAFAGGFAFASFLFTFAK